MGRGWGVIAEVGGLDRGNIRRNTYVDNGVMDAANHHGTCISIHRTTLHVLHMYPRTEVQLKKKKIRTKKHIIIPHISVCG